MNPHNPAPTVSVRYRPTVPLELARPCGKIAERELSSSRADSQALAATTTTRAATRCSAPVVLSMYTQPSVRPARFTVISRAMAWVSSVRRPVAAAGGSRTLVEENAELVAQPRPHCPPEGQGSGASGGPGRVASRHGMDG